MCKSEFAQKLVSAKSGYGVKNIVKEYKGVFV